MKINTQTIFVINEDNSCTLWNNEDDNINSVNKNNIFRFRGQSSHSLHGVDFWDLSESDLEWIKSHFQFNKELSYE